MGNWITKIFILVGCLCLWSLKTDAQFRNKNKEYSGYQKYDDKLITPHLRGRNSISFGGGLSINRSLPDQDVVPEAAFHLGYNYLILQQREYRFSKKNKSKEEIKMSFGAHLTVGVGGEILLNANYYNPLIAIRGRILGWYLFSEYGIGLHRFPDYYPNENKWTPNLSLETVRIRFFKSRFFIHNSLNLDLKNNYLSKQRANWELLFGIRYYI